MLLWFNLCGVEVSINLILNSSIIETFRTLSIPIHKHDAVWVDWYFEQEKFPSWHTQKTTRTRYEKVKFVGIEFSNFNINFGPIGKLQCAITSLQCIKVGTEHLKLCTNWPSCWIEVIGLSIIISTFVMKWSILILHIMTLDISCTKFKKTKQRKLLFCKVFFLSSLSLRLSLIQ